MAIHQGRGRSRFIVITREHPHVRALREHPEMFDRRMNTWATIDLRDEETMIQLQDAAGIKYMIPRKTIQALEAQGWKGLNMIPKDQIVDAIGKPEKPPVQGVTPTSSESGEPGSIIKKGKRYKIVRRLKEE